ncbi:Yip1 family protein [Streptomyces corynorhini]|uniref:YIP1 family protein n=1 Tax=Streptomyces corynorhini TaxID=2282652 RepID=A0A370BAC7_9ACTN|nr:Yip1 family protein [Streptomyces corynorhini]RDG36395.1 YIP1 family protein [Streptomyces corynorhini]
MAGFRIGRGRDNRTPQQEPQRQQQQRQHPQQQPPYGRQAPPPQYGGGSQAAPPYGQQQGQQHWPPAGGGHGEPEYFGGDTYGQRQQPDGYGAPSGPGGQGGHGGGYGGGHGGGYGGQGGHGGPAGRGAPQGDPYANNPGHTQAFSIHEDPYGDGTAYQAGAPAGPAGPMAPPGPRLPWKELLSGIVMRPAATFYQMRDYPVWGPALIVTFVYGLLALFGLDTAREEVINARLALAVPYVLTTAVALVIGSLMLGAVTHTLARQLGGNGAWQPTVGLSMLIMSVTDAPRLLFALFLGGDNSLVQTLGWITWVGAAALFTMMVSKSHDLPWPKALGASAIQLIALLSLLKLGTI